MGNTPEPQAVRDQFARIAASPTFARSKSLTRLLRHLVDAHLGGAGPVKEYALGVEVFDRGEDFDPASDNIVRVQAGNLRNRLKAYYEGPGAQDDVVIRLLPGGYHLQVEPRAAAPVADPVAAAIHRPQRPRWIGIAALTLVCCAATAWWMFQRTPAAKPSVAVLPFSSLDADPAFQYYADGLTEEIIDTLARAPGANVTGRSSIWSYRQKTPPFREIREALRVDSIVEGSVRSNGDRLRILVRILDSNDGHARWSGEFEPERTGIVAAQQQVARAVAAALPVNLGATAQSPRAADPKLYELCQQGRALWFQATPASAHEAISLAAQALVKDPNYAPAYVVMAGAYTELVVAGRESPREDWRRVKEMAAKAIELDPRNAEAHMLLAGPLAWLDWDYAAAEAEYRKALELAPGDAAVHQYFASFLSAFGRFGEAEPHMRRALQLDPRNPLALWVDTRMAYWAGNYARAGAALERLRAEFPAYTLTNNLIPRIWPRIGRTAEAIERLERVPRTGSGLDAYGLLGFVYAQSGDLERAREVARQLEALSKTGRVPATSLAFVYAGIGDRDKAIEALRKACDERSLRTAYLLVDPIFASLRGEPAFQTLLLHTRLRK